MGPIKGMFRVDIGAYLESQWPLSAGFVQSFMGLWGMVACCFGPVRCTGAYGFGFWNPEYGLEYIYFIFGYILGPLELNMHRGRRCSRQVTKSWRRSWKEAPPPGPETAEACPEGLLGSLGILYRVYTYTYIYICLLVVVQIMVPFWVP